MCNQCKVILYTRCCVFLIVKNLTHSLEDAENKEAQEKKINKMKKAKHHCYFGRACANKTYQ